MSNAITRAEIDRAVTGLSEAEVEALMESTLIFKALPSKGHANDVPELRTCVHDEPNDYRVFTSWQR